MEQIRGFLRDGKREITIHLRGSKDRRIRYQVTARNNGIGYDVNREKAEFNN